MKSVLASLTVAMGCLVLGACGSASHGTGSDSARSSSAVASTTPALASAADTRAVTRLLQDYYTAAAAGDGAAACGLIYSPLAEAVPEDYGKPPGPANLRGKTCAVVMSKLFRSMPERMRVDHATLDVREVQAEGNEGLAVLRFKRNPERQFLLHRQRGVWKVGALLDTELR